MPEPASGPKPEGKGMVGLGTTKVYFRLLQAIHHAEIITDALNKDTLPKGMVNKVQKLTTFIKPASPNQFTFTAVQNNTRNWMKNNFLILREHYDNIISQNLKLVGSADFEAFERALKWGRTRYRNKLTASSVDTLKDLVMRSPAFEKQIDNIQSDHKFTEDDFPPLTLPVRNQTGGRSPATRRGSFPSPPNITADWSRPPPPPPSPSGNKAQRVLSIQAQVLNPAPKTQRAPRVFINHKNQPKKPLTCNRPWRDPPLDPENQNKNKLKRHRASFPFTKNAELEVDYPDDDNDNDNICFDSPIRTDRAKSRAQNERLSQSDPCLNWPAHSDSREHEKEFDFQPTSTPSHSPRFQRLLETPRSDSSEDFQETLSAKKAKRSLNYSPKVAPAFYSNVAVSSAGGIDFERSQAERSPPDTKGRDPGSPVRVELEKPTTKDGGNTMMSPAESLHRDNTAAQSDPRPSAEAHSVVEQLLLSRREPRVHPRTTRKLKAWTLTVTKPVLIIGDSNLARIPPFTDPNVQIDSYPGAQIHHITELIRKIPTTPAASEVILSVGLNNGLRTLQPLTNDKQLQQLFSIARSRFPQARVRFPVINFSNRLEREQKQVLEQLNRSIIKRNAYLPEINSLLFQVSPRDPIHWTAKTAQTMLNHWRSELNL